jgi:hypothetical protein
MPPSFGAAIMSEPLNRLEIEYTANIGRLQVIHNEITALMQEAEAIKKKNEHLTYCLSLLGKEIESTEQPVSSRKTSLRDIVLDAIEENESVTIDEAWDRVKKNGINTTKATINSTLFSLFTNRKLVRPEVGIYRKPYKNEQIEVSS